MLESSDTLAADPTYLKLLGRYLKLQDLNLERASLRHWFEPGESQLKLTMRVTEDELVVSGSLGRSLYRVIVGQLCKMRLRASKGLSR